MINGPFLMGKCFKYTIINDNGSMTNLNYNTYIFWFFIETEGNEFLEGS